VPVCAPASPRAVAVTATVAARPSGRRMVVGALAAGAVRGGPPGTLQAGAVSAGPSSFL